MGLQNQKIEALSFVTAELNYLAPTKSRPRTFTFEPPPGELQSNVVPEPHALPIYDARSLVDSISLDREGFALVSTPVIEFVTDDQLGLGEFGIETGNVTPEQEPPPASPAPGAGHTQVFSSPPRATAVRDATRSGRALLLHEGRRLVIAPAGATIGRSRQCDIVLNDPNVSREHAEVRQRGERWFVRDLGSTNGTALNGRRVSGSEAVNSGDEIEIGTSVIGFEIE